MRLVLKGLRLLFAVVFFGLLAAFLLGPSLSVEVAGVEAPGEVVARSERISPRATNWSRDLELEVSYRPVGADERATRRLPVDATTYDATPLGAQVRVRYLPGDDLLPALVNQIGARLASQPPFGGLLARTAGLAPILLGFAVAVALGWAASKLKRWWIALPIVPLVLGGLFVTGAGWQPPMPGGEVRAGTALVREVTRIDRIWESRRSSGEPAVQPFLLVELEFVPAGRTLPVVAVDMVDEGSVRGLERQGEIAIIYSVADPRRAQIDRAARTYVWKNVAGSWGPLVVLLAVVVGLIALWRWWRGRRGAVRP